MEEEGGQRRERREREEEERGREKRGREWTAMGEIARGLAGVVGTRKRGMGKKTEGEWEEYKGK